MTKNPFTNEDGGVIIGEIEKEYLTSVHGLMTRTILQCQQEGLDQFDIIRIVYMNTLYMLMDYSGALRMPKDVFLEMVDRAWQTVEEVQEQLSTHQPN